MTLRFKTDDRVIIKHGGFIDKPTIQKGCTGRIIKFSYNFWDYPYLVMMDDGDCITEWMNEKDFDLMKTFEIGDKVIHRCTQKVGVVSQVHLLNGDKHFYNIIWVPIGLTKNNDQSWCVDNDLNFYSTPNIDWETKYNKALETTVKLYEEHAIKPPYDPKGDKLPWDEYRAKAMETILNKAFHIRVTEKPAKKVFVYEQI